MVMEVSTALTVYFRSFMGILVLHRASFEGWFNGRSYPALESKYRARQVRSDQMQLIVPFISSYSYFLPLIYSFHPQALSSPIVFVSLPLYLHPFFISIARSLHDTWLCYLSLLGNINFLLYNKY